MNFNPNSFFMYGLAGFVILFVLLQSIFFLVRALRRAKAMGMNMKKIKGLILSTSIFTIPLAFSFLLGVITLSKFLGLPLPWIRLSVIGAITYELPAATATAKGMGISLSNTIMDPTVFSSIAWVMTLGILPSIIYVPLLYKRINNGLISMKNRDEKWSDLFMASLFLGMISAFLGMVFADIRQGLVGWIPVFVLLFSALVMAFCGYLIRKENMTGLTNYAMPISMLAAMIFAIVITPLIV